MRCNVIKIQAGEPVPLDEASKLFPGRPPHRATVFRWAMRGVNGVRLETFKVGGRTRYTNLAAVLKFIRRTTKAADPGPTVEPQRRQIRHKRAGRNRANQSLVKLGLLTSPAQEKRRGTSGDVVTNEPTRAIAG